MKHPTDGKSVFDTDQASGRLRLALHLQKTDKIVLNWHLAGVFIA